MKPEPPCTCMASDVAIQPLSVMKALTMGVSSVTMSAASLRTSSSGMIQFAVDLSAMKDEKARPPSA
jgi:hypothetical protein